MYAARRLLRGGRQCLLSVGCLGQESRVLPLGCWDQGCIVCCQLNMRRRNAVFAASRILGGGSQCLLPVEN